MAAGAVVSTWDRKLFCIIIPSILFVRADFIALQANKALVPAASLCKLVACKAAPQIPAMHFICKKARTKWQF